MGFAGARTTHEHHVLCRVGEVAGMQATDQCFVDARLIKREAGQILGSLALATTGTISLPCADFARENAGLFVTIQQHVLIRIENTGAFALRIDWGHQISTWRNQWRTVFRDNPVQREFSRIDYLSRKCIRRILASMPTLIIPSTPA